MRRHDRLADRGVKRLNLPVDHDRVQAFLAAEVLVHDGFGDLGPRGDVLDACPVEALLGECGTSDPDELVPTLGPGHPDTAAACAGLLAVRHPLSLALLASLRQRGRTGARTVPPRTPPGLTQRAPICCRT